MEIMDRELATLVDVDDPLVAALAKEVSRLRKELREESVLCADLAGRVDQEAGAVIRVHAQMREFRNAVGIAANGHPSG